MGQVASRLPSLKQNSTLVTRISSVHWTCGLAKHCGVIETQIRPCRLTLELQNDWVVQEAMVLQVHSQGP